MDCNTLFYILDLNLLEETHPLENTIEFIGDIKRNLPSQITYIDLDREIMVIPNRSERTDIEKIKQYHETYESC